MENKESEPSSYCGIFFIIGIAVSIVSCIAHFKEPVKTREDRINELKTNWDSMTNEEKGEAITEELQQTNPELFD
jgi:hypothetical protein